MICILKVKEYNFYQNKLLKGIVTEWFWKRWNDGNVEIKEFMEANYPPNFTYQDFGSQLKMEFFDPYWWAELVKKSGAK